MADTPELIDFPVSDDWLDFYHRQGLTPRMSPHYFNRLDERYLNDRLGKLAEEVSVLGAEVERLRKQRVAPATSKSREVASPPAKPKGLDV